MPRLQAQEKDLFHPNSDDAHDRNVQLCLSLLRSNFSYCFFIIYKLYYNYSCSCWGGRVYDNISSYISQFLYRNYFVGQWTFPGECGWARASAGGRDASWTMARQATCHTLGWSCGPMICHWKGTSITWCRINGFRRALTTVLNQVESYPPMWL